MVRGSRHPLIATKDAIHVGCMREGLDWWREHHEAVGRKQGYTSAQVAEYRRHIEYAAEWLAEQAQEVRS